MSTNQDNLFYTIAVSMINNIGGVTARNLIAYCGSAEKVFSTPKSKLIKIPLIGEERAKEILNADVLKKAEEEMKFISSYQIHAMTYSDEDYPYRLKDNNDAPLLLFYKGNAPLNQKKIMAIVGTRKITEYGKELIEKFVADLAGQNILVVSGMAYGVDIKAHNECVEQNIPTIGVLGHGLNTLYPAIHKSTAKKMVANGGLLTEFSSQHKFLPGNFPARNRIIAGISDAIVVVESAISGGALITANIANSYGKDVFTFPGKITDKYSAGCNFLLKTFKATMIENATDFLLQMNWKDNENTPKKPRQLNLQLNKKEQAVYQIILDGCEIEIDRLAAVAQLDTSDLAAILLEMELNNVIVSLPGKRYKALG